MKSLFFIALFFGSASLFAEEPNPQCPALLRFSMESLEGQNKVNFCDAYRGKVILAVNTASQCGYTPQLGGLQQLYLEYKSKGLVVLGFPSGDFKQEHSNPLETAKVAREQYGVSFRFSPKVRFQVPAPMDSLINSHGNQESPRNGTSRNISSIGTVRSLKCSRLKWPLMMFAFVQLLNLY